MNIYIITHINGIELNTPVVVEADCTEDIYKQLTVTLAKPSTEEPLLVYASGREF